MSQQQGITPPYPEEKENKKKKLRWLPVLFLLTFLTSCIAGYILGKNAGSVPTGQIIDTILLSPEKEPEKKTETILHLSGQAVYNNGTPAAGRTMELHSTPIRTVTDENGFFLFPNVVEGEHTVSVLNEDGTVAAQRAISLSREDSIAGADVVLQDSGSYVIQLSVNVRLLEITVELDGEELYINPERLTWASSDGMVTTPAGTASAAERPVVTPCGNVCLSDGTIVFPGGKEIPVAIILPDDTVLFPKELTTLNEGAKVQPDGVVILPDGTQIYPGGIVVTPDGEKKEAGSSGLIVEDGTAVPIGGGASPAQPDERTDAPKAEEPGSEGKITDKPLIPGEQEEELPSDGQEVKPSLPEESGGTAAPGTGGTGEETGGEGAGEKTEPSEETGRLTVSGQKESGKEFVDWTQNSTLDLFYDRTTGMPYEKIAPGTKGYYLFQLQNSRQGNLHITLTLTEATSLHLPLIFTLTPLDGDGNKLEEDAVSGGLAKDKKEITLENAVNGNGIQKYRLDWQWPLNGNDAEDTAAGNAGGTYMLSLSIHAEEEN